MERVILAQQGRIKRIVSEMKPDHTVEFELKRRMLRFRVADRRGVQVAVSDYDFLGVIATWTDYVLERVVETCLHRGVNGSHNTPSQRAFAEQTGAKPPMLNDSLSRKATKDNGVPMEGSGLSNRTTFVVDQEGKITHIEEGRVPSIPRVEKRPAD